MFTIDDSAKTCAVVGNSGILLKEEYGELIDSHDFIIRFNQATTENYEKHVGSRTDLRLVNGHMFGCLMPNSSHLIKEHKELFSKFDPEFILKIKNEAVLIKNNVDINTLPPYVLETLERNGCLLHLLSKETLSLLSQSLKMKGSIEPSTGMVGVFLAEQAFKEVSCFGFSFYEESWESRHYYENLKPYDQSVCHSFNLEKDWMLGLHKQNKIRLY